jgi:hypothetical protein
LGVATITWSFNKLPDMLLTIFTARTSACTGVFEPDVDRSLSKYEDDGSGGGVVVPPSNIDAGEFGVCALLGLRWKNGVIGLFVTDTLNAS